DFRFREHRCDFGQELIFRQVHRALGRPRPSIGPSATQSFHEVGERLRLEKTALVLRRVLTYPALEDSAHDHWSKGGSFEHLPYIPHGPPERFDRSIERLLG